MNSTPTIEDALIEEIEAKGPRHGENRSGNRERGHFRAPPTLGRIPTNDPGSRCWRQFDNERPLGRLGIGT